MILCEGFLMLLKKTLPFSFLGAAFILLNFLRQPSAEAESGRTFNPIMLANGIDAADKAVVMWSAFGSGCQAVQEIPSEKRDIELRILPKNAVQIPQLTFDLSFAHFQIPGQRTIEKDNRTEMYSECALRFAIRGQPGRRIKRIEAQATVDIRKPKGATLYLYNELRFGGFGGDEKKLIYDEQTDIKDTNFKLNLARDLATYRIDGKSSCGSDQVLFYEFTMVAKKPSKGRDVSVSFPAPSRVSVRLDYESC